MTILSDIPSGFLILNLPVICVGNLQQVQLKQIKEACTDLPVCRMLDLEDDNNIFSVCIPDQFVNNHIAAV